MIELVLAISGALFLVMLGWFGIRAVKLRRRRRPSSTARNNESHWMDGSGRTRGDYVGGDGHTRGDYVGSGNF